VREDGSNAIIGDHQGVWVKPPYKGNLEKQSKAKTTPPTAAEMMPTVDNIFVLEGQISSIKI
jgi:hypothetical protein